MDGRVILRQSVTLAEQLSLVTSSSSCNLRDLLKRPDDDDVIAGRGITLASAIAADKRDSSATSTSNIAAAAGRTLLDIIQEERGDDSGREDDHLFLRRAISIAEPTSPEVSQTERVSLMALLEQTERRWSGSSHSHSNVMEQEDDEQEVEMEEIINMGGEREEGGNSNNNKNNNGVLGGCCVCMVCAKGAAFIPCGHTFCRACARELWAARGRCPLCNAVIVEVLDIF